MQGARRRWIMRPADFRSSTLRMLERKMPDVINNDFSHREQVKVDAVTPEIDSGLQEQRQRWKP